MTSKPASRRARATTFAPRSCPSRPGLATRMRTLREEASDMVPALSSATPPVSTPPKTQGDSAPRALLQLGLLRVPPHERGGAALVAASGGVAGGVERVLEPAGIVEEVDRSGLVVRQAR